MVRLRNLTACILGILLLPSAIAGTDARIFSSGSGKVTTIELFTSEGCSSCPPADAWLSRLVDDPRLWKEIVPMAFHVDYWDYIGWRDRFAHAKFSERQRSHQRQGDIRTVYTPGFIVDGKEWRGWFRGRKVPLAVSEESELTLRMDGTQISAEYPVTGSRDLDLNLALLGFNLSNHVQKGENAGKLLKHDFVVLATHSESASNGHWKFDFAALNEAITGELGIAAWVSARGDLTPIQATGGWLNDESGN